MNAAKAPDAEGGEQRFAPPRGLLDGAPARRALLIALVASVLLLRLASLGAYPLMDTSEARYGEIARVMLVTGNWVTPQETPGTPFWAKPPLYAWLSAASLQVFGINEFALRLPSLLCSLGVLVLCLGWARSYAARLGPEAAAETAWLAGALLSTSVLFFVSAGAVMTDPALALCVTWMLAAFHHAAIDGSRHPAWRWGLFAAAGLGMLAKGPVALLYAGVPIGVWMLRRGRWFAAWRALPWLRGALLALAICTPWYVLAELRTPGFLNYFLLGEHVMRFLKPGWSGDLYGNAHSEAPGTIWLYFVGAFGIATLALALAAAQALIERVRERVRERARAAAGAADPDPARELLLAATLFPPLFFTLAGNIIWTYVLPALAPVAILLARHAVGRGTGRWRAGIATCLVAAWSLLVVAYVAWVPAHTAARSTAALVDVWRQHEQDAPGPLVYWGRKAPASLRFYSRGQAQLVADLAAEQARRGGRLYVVVEPERVASVGEQFAARPAVRVRTLIVDKTAALLELDADR